MALTPTQTWTLAGFLRQVSQEIDSIDPYEVGMAAASRISPEHLAEVLPRLLARAYQDQVTRPSRPTHHQSRRVGSTQKQDHHAMYLRILQSQETFVIEGETYYKFLGDMAPDEVAAAAAMRRKVGEQNLAVAVRYEEVHRQMRRRRAKVVADLPESVLAEIFDV